MANKLREICDRKREEVEVRQRSLPRSALERDLPAEPARGFAAALRATADADQFALIAEIKKASPSKGLIRADFDPGTLAQAYAVGGATCLSVLTEEYYFQGSDQALKAARHAAKLPCLRKDFTVDAYQVFEARVIGADAILLIVAALDDEELRSFAAIAHEIGLDVLIEVHDKDELRRALHVEMAMLGINNRDLKSLRVRTETTIELAPQVPDDRLVIAESGLSSTADLERMHRAGARAFLVGEALMRQADVERATRELLGLNA